MIMNYYQEGVLKLDVLWSVLSGRQTDETAIRRGMWRGVCLLRQRSDRHGNKPNRAHSGLK